MSDDLLLWLRATIEGDKAAAEKVRAEVWTAYEEPWEKGESAMIKVGESGRDGYSCGCCTTGSLDPDRAAHMAIHDPRDTIARCEADLALLDEHAVDDTGFGKYCRVCSEYSTKPGEGGELEPAGAPCRTVRILACGYKNRAGYPGDALE